MIVKRTKLNFWERLYLPAVVAGFRVTRRHFFKKKVTMQYPEEKWTVPRRLSRRALPGQGPGGPHQMRLLPALRIYLPAQGHPHHPARPGRFAGGGQRGKGAQGIQD